MPWRRKTKNTPVFLLGESHGQRSLTGYNPWGCKESDMTKQLTLSRGHRRLLPVQRTPYTKKTPGQPTNLCKHLELLTVFTLYNCLFISLFIPTFDATCYSVTQLCSILCDPSTKIHLDPPKILYLDPPKFFGLQHARPSCSLLYPRVCSDPCPLSQWCHPTISSSVIPFSSCPWPFPASRSFPVSQLFTSGGQSIGVSASASVLLMSVQDWFPLGLAGLILQWDNLNKLFAQPSNFCSTRFLVWYSILWVSQGFLNLQPWSLFGAPHSISCLKKS